MNTQTSTQVLDAIIGMAPHWYEASAGPVRHSLTIGSTSKHFYTHTNLTPALGTWLSHARSKMSAWEEFLSNAAHPSASKLLEEDLVLAWLNQHDNNVDWQKLLIYADDCSNRTYENDSVSFNLLITEGGGTQDITSPENQKILDPLGGSQFTYFKTDKNLRAVSFDRITWSEINESTDYKYYPEFLHPLVSQMSDGDYAACRTSRGDLVILDKMGLLAAKRKGSWKIYDCQTFKNMLRYAFRGEYRLACNLFELMFDLSFKRHGALLVYDPDNRVQNEVINQSSKISDPFAPADPLRSMLTRSIATIRLDESTELLNKRLLLDICSMDGATIFNKNGISAFGAMIKSHADVSSLAGARTTAAESAYMWGGTSLKVSSDGEITIYFKSRDEQNPESVVNAKLNIL